MSSKNNEKKVIELKFSFKKIKSKAAAILAIATMGVQLIAPVAVNAATPGSTDELTFHLTGVTSKGYIRVDRQNGSAPEYMISDQFADQFGRIAYCLDSEKPTPNGDTLPGVADGGDRFAKMFLNGFPTKSAAELGTANDEEAWYATQVVAWTLSGDWRWDQIVWSTPEQDPAAVQRVHNAAQQIYNAATDGTPIPQTSFDVQEISKEDKDGFHQFTYRVNSNKPGVAAIKLNQQIAGLQLVGSNGQPLANNTVNVNDTFTVKVPVTNGSGNASFDVNGSVTNFKSTIYGNGSETVQRAIAAFTADESPVAQNISFGWTRGQGRVNVTKIDADTKAKLKDAEFTLTDQTGAKQVAKTDANGLAGFQILQGNTYDLTETKTPNGYHGGFEQKGITLANDGQTFDYTVSNKLNKGTISVHKFDQDNKVLAGAEFTLTDNSGKSVKAVTNKTGLATFTIEANKVYDLKETKNPAGYNGSFEKKGITLANDGQKFEYSVGNNLNKGTIKVHKVDQDKKPLKGAEFTLTDGKGGKTKAVTDKDGYAQFSIKANQVYSLDETKIPAGYHGGFHKEGITVANDGQTFEYAVSNILNRGTVKVHKVDQDGKALKDAEFTLTDNNGKKLVATTNSKGYAAFNLEANKTYALDETKNPTGYNGTFHKEGITVAKDQQVFEYTAQNNLNKGKVQIAKVDENGKPVKGAEFTLTDNDGKKVVATTDEKGFANFGVVANKTYALDETKVPAGYSGSYHKDGISIKNDGDIVSIKAVNMKDKIQTLIKTGSKKPMAMAAIIVGLALLIVALVLFVKDRKKNMNA